jgi:hypothetical protein
MQWDWMQYMSSSVRLPIESPAVFVVDNHSDNNYCGLQHYKNRNVSYDAFV